MNAENFSLTERAYRAIEEQIVTLVRDPGEVLSENALALSLGIGRTPVREALQQLAREGLIVVLPRRGIMVSEIDVRQQLELLRVRRVVERLMAELCARRALATEREAFTRIEQGMRKASERDDDKRFMRLDQELNGLISSCCRNEFAQRAMGLMSGLSRRFWYMHYREAADLALCASLHADLAAGIASGKVDEAVRATDALLDYTESFTRRAVDAVF